MIRHIAGLAEIVEDMAAAVDHYRRVLGLPVEWEPGSPYALVKVAGVAHFGIWLRSAAAERLYGSADAAERVPLGYHVEYEVDAVTDAAARLEREGIRPLQAPQTEPWGQITTRYASVSGALAGLAETPWARGEPTPEAGEPACKKP